MTITDVKEYAIDRSRVVVHIRHFKLLKTLYGSCFMLARKPAPISSERRKYCCCAFLCVVAAWLWWLTTRGLVSCAVVAPVFPRTSIAASMPRCLDASILDTHWLLLLRAACCTPPPPPGARAGRARSNNDERGAAADTTVGVLVLQEAVLEVAVRTSTCFVEASSRGAMV